ncbi:hypothetical protein [Lyngbya aestuarii]|uniref:hypothetical protein n=1 Tax=Lyngbya aestuarii TaxID=118322 RepID=UPI00403D88A1
MPTRYFLAAQGLVLSAAAQGLVLSAAAQGLVLSAAAQGLVLSAAAQGLVLVAAPLSDLGLAAQGLLQPVASPKPRIEAIASVAMYLTLIIALI